MISYLPSLCEPYIAGNRAEICDETDVQPWTCTPLNAASSRSSTATANRLLDVQVLPLLSFIIGGR